MKNFLRKIKFIIWRIYSITIKDFVFDIHVTDHCNLNCKSCNHYSPISPENFINIKNLKIDLNNLLLISNSIKEIRILGGEPLLNSQLTEIIKIIRYYLPKTNISIFTNGILLNNKNICNDNFWNVCYENKITINITIYPYNFDYQRIKNICEKYKVKFKIFSNKAGDKSFYLYNINPKGKSSKSNYYRCIDNSCLQIREGKIFSCAPSAYINLINETFNFSFKHLKNDYILIKDIKNTWSLRKFMLFPRPFCKYCQFPRSPIDWGKSKKQINEWVTFN